MLAAPAAAAGALTARPSAQPLGLLVRHMSWQETGKNSFRITVEFDGNLLGTGENGNA